MKIIFDGKRRDELEKLPREKLASKIMKYIGELEEDGLIVKGFYINDKGIINYWQELEAQLENNDIDKIEVEMQDREELLNDTLKKLCYHIDDMGLYAQDLNAQLQWEWNPEEILEKSLNRGLIRDVEWIYKAIDCLQLSLSDELLKRDFDHLSDAIEEFLFLIREGKPADVGNFLEHKLGKELKNIRGRLAECYYHRRHKEI